MNRLRMANVDYNVGLKTRAAENRRRPQTEESANQQTTVRSYRFNTRAFSPMYFAAESLVVSLEYSMVELGVAEGRRNSDDATH